MRLGSGSSGQPEFWSLLAAAVCLFAPAAALADYRSEYDAYMAAFEMGDAAKAIEHGEKAWREAETELGDHPTTAVLAFNYANVVYDTDPVKAAAAFERALAITDRGLGSLKADELRLNIAVARVAADRKNDDSIAALRTMLETRDQTGAAPTFYSAEGWRFVAMREFEEERYDAAKKASDRARADAEALVPQPKRLIAQTLTISGVALLRNKNRRGREDLIEAVQLLDMAIVMFPLQESIDSIDPLLADAFLWRFTANAIASSEGRTTALKGVDKELDADALGRRKMKDAPTCALDWASQPKPAYPSEAKREGEIGAVLIGFDVYGVRIGRTVVIASHNGSAFTDSALKAMKSWKLKRPAPEACRKNHFYVISFSLI